MSILHQYTHSVADAGATSLVHAADWLAAHEVDAGTSLYGFCPVGAVIPWAGLVGSPPSGFLVCDGSSLLRAGTYADLFAAIGTAWGAADGSHFYIPDCRDHFLIGATADSGGAAKATITGAAAQTYAAAAWTLTHSMTIAAHTLTHAGFSVAAHPDLTHAALGLANHPSTSMTISVGAQDTVTDIKTTSITKTASRATVVTASTHAVTGPTRAAITHNVSAGQTTHSGSVYGTHALTQPADHGSAGSVTHSFTPPAGHSSTPVPAFLALGYVIRYA